MLREHLEKTLLQVLKDNAQTLNLAELNGSQNMLAIERPRDTQFGDYAVNVSPLAKYAKMPPPKIAEILEQGFKAHGFTPSIVGAFLNFKISDEQLIKSLVDLVRNEKPGHNKSLESMHCLLEFVSANPTGPLHIGHGRWVALGDSLARIFEHCGAKVLREFYINDAGVQMFNISNSVWYRALEILETGGKMPEPVEGQPHPFYPGEYVIDMAQAFLKTNKEKVLAWDNAEHKAPPEAIEALSAFARETMLAEQRQLMERCRLQFDEWFSEKSLYKNGEVEKTVKLLKEHNATYEKDGALWFESTKYGDDQDRVLMKSDGSYTYLTPDIAYFENKHARDNNFYNRFIYIWGADHHGYIPRMRAAVEALGYDVDQFEVILGQLVNLIIDGEKTRMGKRKKMLTLEELVDEVGVDAVRFWMVSKSQDTALDFNVELAASSSDENPVFYVQYAHARCCSILRNAFQERLDTIDKTTKPPVLDEAAWKKFIADLSEKNLSDLFEKLENDQAKTALRELILKLDSLEDVVATAAKNRLPHTLARYTQDVAADFHHFYAVCRVLVDDKSIAQSRLVVILALKKVIAQVLELLGVSAPESM